MIPEHGNVLIVDDDPLIRLLFRKLLYRNYSIGEAASGEEALDLVAQWVPDLVLLDIMLPGMDGLETCRRIRSCNQQLPPQIIMVSGHSAPQQLKQAFDAGADDYLIKPIDPNELRSRVELHFRLRQSQAMTEKLQRTLTDHHSDLKRIDAERAQRIVAVQDVTVFTLAKVAELRDNDTGKHVIRMREYAQLLAKELQRQSPYADLIDQSFLADLYRSSPLHDIGKVGIPDNILLKPGRLESNEMDVMKRHTVIGADILHEAATQPMVGGFLNMAVSIARYHHERWDGKGYPYGIAGEKIPLEARIVAVADVYDALTSDRPYKKAWKPDNARAMIKISSGTQFDPHVVEAFERCFGKILEFQKQHSDANGYPTPVISSVPCPALAMTT